MELPHLNESVVQDEHNGSEIPSYFRVEEQHLSDITDVTSLWVSKTELPNHILEEIGKTPCKRNSPNYKGSVQNKSSLDDRQDKTRGETQYRVRVRKGHDGQANVLREE